MKKHLFYASLFVAALSSCSKDDDRISTPAGEVNKDLEEIKLTVSNNEAFGVETRGTGMVGGLTAADNKWNGQTLYILMTDTGTVNPVMPDYEYEGLGEYILNNVAVTAPVGTVGGLVTGKPESNNEIGHHYYYPIKGLFDFYGYHVDDALTQDTVRTDSSITVTVRIDGSQDLMVAKANFEADDLDLPELEGLSYGAYAARRKVQPVLSFKHLLSQLQFNVLNKGDKTLYVDSIGISAVDSATMTVAGKNHGKIEWVRENSSDTTMLFVQKAGQDGKFVALEDVELATGAQTATPIGYLLVPAGTENAPIFSYEGEIRLIQELPVTVVDSVDGKAVFVDDTVKVRSTIPFTITLPETLASRNFAAGYAYTININVYGLSQIGVTAQLTQWVDGGSFDVTPEDQVTTGEEAVFTSSFIKKAYVVDTREEYYQLPKAYRGGYGEWGTPNLQESLPWIAIDFETTTAERVAFVLDGPNSFSKEITALEFGGQQGQEIALVTFAKTDPGFENVTMEGEWTISIKVDGEVKDTVTITVPNN